MHRLSLLSVPLAVLLSCGGGPDAETESRSSAQLEKIDVFEAGTHGYAHYRSYCHDGYFGNWSYGGHVYYGFNPHIRVAPIYGRLSTVFTLDDAVFDGAEKSDADGLPQRRTKPVGSRFLQ